MAIGIACSNTGLKEALDVLKPLRNDTVDFVRQGAHIATALVLMLRPHPEVAPPPPPPPPLPPSALDGSHPPRGLRSILENSENRHMEGPVNFAPRNANFLLQK